jgi:NHL repeat
MSNPSDIFRSLLSRLGVAGPARLRAFQGSGAPKKVSGSGAPKIASRTVLVLATALAVLALAAPPAGAAQTRRELGTFGGASSSVVDPYPLSNPQGMAVDEETEDVYVADTGNHRVEKFSVSGQFLLAFGGNVGGVGVDVCGGLVACVPGVEGSAPGDLTTPTFVAVDNDPSSPSYHDVYVADTADDIVSKFTQEGELVATWGNNGAAGAANGQLTGFALINGIAVGANGTLYVANFNHAIAFYGLMDEFEPNSKLISELPEIGYGAPAVNPAGDLFLGSEREIVESLPTGEKVGYVFYEPSRSGVKFSGLAVASNGDLYFAPTAGVLDHDSFNGAGEVLEPGGATCPVNSNLVGYPEEPVACGVSDSVQVGFAGSGIAVASGSGDTFLADAGAGTVYRYGPLVTALPPEVPSSEQAPAGEVKATSAKLQGVWNANATEDESGLYEFLYRPSASECEGAGGKATPLTPTMGKRGEAVSSVVGELLPNTVYTFCLRVSNGAGETAIGAPVHFTTRVAVPLPSELSVSDVAATSATLNASVNPGGAATSYVFELAAAGGTFAPASEAGGAGTVAEGTQGVPVSVHTQSLRAGTVYQFRVSATNSAGTVVSEPLSFTTQAAGGFVLPDGRQWELVSPPDKHGASLEGIAKQEVVQASVDGDAITYVAAKPTESEPQGYGGLVQVFSTRGPDGWTSRDISIPHEKAAGFPLGEGPEYEAFSEDLSLALVQPHGPFESSLSAEASEQTPYLRTLYLNGNVNEPCTRSCYRPLVTGCPSPQREAEGYPCPQAVSEHANVPAGTVFGARCAFLCGPVFVGATPDLSHIALHNYEPDPLVSGSKSQEYEWVDGHLSEGQHLPELRVGSSVDGSWTYFVASGILSNHGVPVPGAVSGHCPKGGEGGSASQRCNLYVSHDGTLGLVAVLSAEDAPDWDGSGVINDDLDNDLYHRMSRVSPNGKWLAFMSERPLTGYDNTDANSGQPDEEVYLYHAPEDLASEPGSLVCASCDPTGARPVGVELNRLDSGERGLVIEGGTGWEGTAPYNDPWIAASVPGWTPFRLQDAIYQSRYLSNGGRLFFDSNDALVPQDVNGNEDVYEYEPEGIESPEGRVQCSESTSSGSEVFKPGQMVTLERGTPQEHTVQEGPGCVALISSGQDAKESAFLDASESGSDVFFLTAAKLTSNDSEGGYSLYDAHECTDASPCIPAPAVLPPPCDTGDSCKPAPTPQPTIFGAPASATFSGPGNITPEVAGGLGSNQKVVKKTVKCPKSRTGNRKGKCIKTRKKAKRAKRASNDGRAE